MINKTRNHISKVPAAEPDSLVPKGRRKRLTRAERASSAREEIFAAAVKVVGEHGYAGASINLITAEAGIAQGTFYLYFKSRQELFDELLPHVGVDMLDYLRDRVTGAKDYYDMEERAIRGFFDYCHSNPWFFRVLNEAEVAAPLAHRKHFKLITQRYVKSLERAIAAKEIRNYDRTELETIAYMLMATRIYLHLRMKNGGVGKQLEKIIKTYMKLVRNGLK